MRAQKIVYTFERQLFLELAQQAAKKCDQYAVRLQSELRHTMIQPDQNQVYVAKRFRGSIGGSIRLFGNKDSRKHVRKMKVSSVFALRMDWHDFQRLVFVVCYLICFMSSLN